MRTRPCSQSNWNINRRRSFIPTIILTCCFAFNRAIYATIHWQHTYKRRKKDAETTNITLLRLLLVPMSLLLLVVRFYFCYYDMPCCVLCIHYTNVKAKHATNYVAHREQIVRVCLHGAIQLFGALTLLDVLYCVDEIDVTVILVRLWCERAKLLNTNSKSSSRT